MEMQTLEKLLVNSRLWNFFHARFNLSRVFTMIAGDPGPVVLELGCGAGFTTGEILKRFPNVRVLAIDYDVKQVEAVRQRLVPFGKRVSVQQGDATALAVPMASVDTVFEFNAFHHIREWGKALDEVQRVLKPGGTFYAMDTSRHFTMMPVIRALSEGFFTKEEFIQRLGTSGLRVRQATGDGLVFYLAAENVQSPR